MIISLFSISLLQASDLFQAIESKKHQKIHKLLKSNPDLDCLNIQGQTVLIKAVQTGNSNLVSKLLRKKAAVNTVDIYGKTALDYAVELNNKRIAKMLLKAEAMVTTENNAVVCQKLVKSMSSFSGWWIFAGLVIGVTCLACIVGGGFLLTMGAFMGGPGTAFPYIVIGASTLVGAMSVYGTVKMCRRSESQLYGVNIMQTVV